MTPEMLPAVAQSRCSWCKTIVRYGSLPETHSICGPCVDLALAEAGLRAVPCAYCGVPSKAGDCGECKLTFDQVREFIRRRLA